MFNKDIRIESYNDIQNYALTDHTKEVLLLF